MTGSANKSNYADDEKNVSNLIYRKTDIKFYQSDLNNDSDLNLLSASNIKLLNRK